MYLFGFPEGLSGGSKETSYLTNYNTSRGTSRTTSYNTGWYTGRTTSRATNWSSTGQTGWNTSLTTSKSTNSVASGVYVNMNTTTVGGNCHHAFYIYWSGDKPVLNSYFYWYNPSVISPITDNNGAKFLNIPSNYSSAGWYGTASKSRFFHLMNVWVDGVQRCFTNLWQWPTWDELYNASEIIIELNTGWENTGFHKTKIKMGTTRFTGSSQVTHFYANTNILSYDASQNVGRIAYHSPTVGQPQGVNHSIPYGTQSTSWSTAGPMTYKSTAYALSRNTSYGTSVYTARGTSKGTSFTTTYGTSHTTDHITYG